MTSPAPSKPRPLLTAQWRVLAMLNFAIDPDLLLPHVPLGTELDSWEGRTYVSIVGFRFLQTRLVGLPIPGHIDFEEVNLRFYVRRREPAEVRRGVVFLRELVPRRAVAWMARLLYNEPYRALPMHHRIEHSPSGEPRSVTYGWRRNEQIEQFALEVTGPPAIPATTSEGSFIAEHYWGYTKQRDGSTIEYQVEHPPWRVSPARATRFELDVATLYGKEFVRPLEQSPTSVFLAEGSAVAVHRPRRLTP